MNHLCMHIYPKAGGPWRDAVDDLRQRAGLFDGRRAFGVVCGDGLESPEIVKAFIGDLATDWIVYENTPSLREVMTFPSLLTLLQGMPGRLFYCHTKGATHSADSICQEWRRVMFETCLDFPEVVDCLLADSPICGPFRRLEGLGVRFHFSGSFYWVRCADLWGRRWGDVQQVWHGVESYPARQFTLEESACLFLDNCGDLYSPAYWERTVRPAITAWRRNVRSCIGRMAASSAPS